MNSFKIIVLVKQVPDTRHVGPDAMKPDGTVNRGKLPSVFNPDDLNALEMALKIKDRFPETHITVLTMGPPKAAEIMRESLYRGADKAILVSDRRFGGADTLATSYTLAQAIRKIGEYDLIFGGRQAIDGDTAQVGPQTAEKIGLPQVTYALEIQEITQNRIVVLRKINKGTEVVRAPLPCLLTVHGEAPECRQPIAKNVMKYKYARAESELRKTEEYIQELIENRPYLRIYEWNVEDIEADPKRIGLPGSPTKVKSVESVTFKATESKSFTTSDEDIDALIKELIEKHTIG